MARTKNSHDDRVRQLIDDVKRRRAEIAKAQGKAQYQTSNSISVPAPDGTTKLVNLHVETDVSRLISIAAMVRRAAADYYTAATDLGVSNPPTFKYGGFTVDAWFEDIKTRIGRVLLSEKQAELATLEKRLDGIISPELRREMELADITAQLGSM